MRWSKARSGGRLDGVMNRSVNSWCGRASRLVVLDRASRGDVRALTPIDLTRWSWRQNAMINRLKSHRIGLRVRNHSQPRTSS